jgi:hypothetical protein
MMIKIEDRLFLNFNLMKGFDLMHSKKFVMYTVLC